VNNQRIITFTSPQNTVNINTNNVDSVTPYSFQDWLASHVGVLPGQEYQQYNQYLTKWYTNKSEQTVSNINQIRLNYLNLLSQLQLFIPNEQLENWYNQINIQDERELLLAIPYYAKRLRDIALYYCRLRDTLKKTKLQYNLVGSKAGLTQQVLSEIQQSYAKRPNSTITLPASVWSTIPQLSSIQDTINIHVEDLYDFQTYQGQSPDVAVSEYFNLNDETTTTYFASLGLTLSSDDWVYSTGNINLSADTTDTATASLQSLLVNKYLGEDKFTGQLISTNLSSNAVFFNTSISAGNNFFYWPNNPYVTTAFNRQRFKPILIQDSGLDTVATAGSTIKDADTVFIKTPRGVEGAWYRHVRKEVTDATMVFDINASDESVFRFPFPGYGLSGEDLNWTGISLSSTPLYNYLPYESRQAVEGLYWSTNTSLTSVEKIKLNDTTLIENKAYANILYRNADKVQIWQTPPAFNSTAYSGQIQEAWLYAMYKTDIPISGYTANSNDINNIASSTNTVIWPFERITENKIAALPPDIDKICNPTPLTGVYLPNATAGLTIDTADVIYKVNNYSDSIANATECAWLSGSVYKTMTLSAVCQPGFNAYFVAGNYTKFVWLGPDNTDISDVFTTINHEPDCEYVTSNSNYLDNNKCTCRAVLFSPFGHPGETYNDYNGLCDFILPDINPFETFNLTWLQGDNFAWYKTRTDIGWGNGNWVTNQPCKTCVCNKTAPVDTNIKLKTGHVYIYGRANVRDRSPATHKLPSLVVRYYFTNPYCVWVKAIKQNNRWVTTDTVTDMIVRPGDYLKFIRPNKTKFTALSSITNNVKVAENHISIWSDYDYVTIGTPVTLSFPQPTNTDIKLLNKFDPYKQYPLEHFNNIVNYDAWSVTDPKGEIYIFKNTGSFTFKSTDPGIYTFALTATVMWHKGKLTDTANNTDDPIARERYIFTCIPPVTAILQNVGAVSLTSYDIPVPGYVINTPLKGWSYNMCAPDPCIVDYFNNGARPYWAVSYNEKTTETNYRSIIDWGVPQRWFDEHNCVTQPIVSPISLTGGEYFKYVRNYNSPITWTQPLTLNIDVNKKQWCVLEYNTLSLATLSSTLNNIYTNLVTVPLTTVSTLEFKDFVNNQPTEVFYNALNPFVWNISAIPIIKNAPETAIATVSSINANTPWKNTLNRFYPIIATMPYLGALSSSSEIGDFFTPNNLGISYFIDENYSYKLTNSADATSGLFESPSIHVGGRGLTKQDQATPYTVTGENNTWFKEPTTAGDAAGNIKKDIARKYQKFIPYQSNIESNVNAQVGLITTKTLQTPWGGSKDTTWIDNNSLKSFARQISLSSWSDTQILTQTGKDLDNWVTDIHNNQYGLFKDLTDVTVPNRKYIPGNIWVKSNNDVVSPAYVALSSVYSLYKSIFLYDQIIDSGVTKIDTFFDTLYVETSGAIFFNKLTYDYNTNVIGTNFDNARCLSLAIPVRPTLQRELTSGSYNNFVNTYNKFAVAGDTWFFPERKKVLLSVCSLVGGAVIPELYSYDIIDSSLKRVFPTAQDDITSLVQLRRCGIINVNKPVLSYDDITRTYLITTLCTDNENNYFIIEVTLSDATLPRLTKINVYCTSIPNSPLNTMFDTEGSALVSILEQEYITAIS
jgi:hypothetical protein